MAEEDEGPSPEAQKAIEEAGIPPHLRPGRKEMTDHKVLFPRTPRKDEDGVGS